MLPHHHHAHLLPLDYGSWFYFILAIGAGAIALGYTIHTLLSRDPMYRKQRFGAMALTVGQGIFAWYWHGRIGILSPTSLLQTAAFWLAWIVTGVGLVGMTQRQSSKTWLWF